MSPTRKKAPEAGEPTICPWCSASVPAGAASCPSCGAALQESGEADVLGVTQIDPNVLVRTPRAKPGRLATWLGAEAPDVPDLGGRIEPPSPEVREEMLRIEMAAIDAEIESRATRAEVQRQIDESDAQEARGPGAAGADAPGPDAAGPDGSGPDAADPDADVPGDADRS